MKNKWKVTMRYPFKVLSAIEEIVMVTRKTDFEKHFLETVGIGWTSTEVLGISFSADMVYIQYVRKHTLARDDYGTLPIKAIHFKRWM